MSHTLGSTKVIGTPVLFFQVLHYARLLFPGKIEMGPRGGLDDSRTQHQKDIKADIFYPNV